MAAMQQKFTVRQNKFYIKYNKKEIMSELKNLARILSTITVKKNKITLGL